MKKKEEFYLLVAGSRGFNDYELLKTKLDICLMNHMDKEIHIVEGEARGADLLARQYAEEKGYIVHPFPADWSIGKSAGYRRNEKMHLFIKDKEYKGCVCFWDGESRGTRHNFDLASQYKTPLRVVMYKEEK